MNSRYVRLSLSKPDFGVEIAFDKISRTVKLIFVMASGIDNDFMFLEFKVVRDGRNDGTDNGQLCRLRIEH